MRGNRHDSWNAFCEKHRVVLDQTGLPTSIIRSEQRFRDLLEAGQVVLSDTQISLKELTPKAWSALYQFSAVFFQEFESFMPEKLFLAFDQEVRRRGDKFPR